MDLDISVFQSKSFKKRRIGIVNTHV